MAITKEALTFMTKPEVEAMLGRKGGYLHIQPISKASSCIGSSSEALISWIHLSTISEV